MTQQDQFWDRVDAFRDEVRSGESPTVAHEWAHKRRAFAAKHPGRDATPAELYAMGLTFGDLLSPTDLEEGKRLQAAGFLAAVMRPT